MRDNFYWLWSDVKYVLTRLRIRAKYRFRIARINVRKWDKMIRLDIARFLIHLAFKVSPDANVAIKNAVIYYHGEEW